jgi:hypothetical protein
MPSLKFEINRKTKARLASFLDWVASFIILLSSLTFIYSAQAFKEKNLQAWSDVFTTLGSIALSLISLHMGIRLQQAKEKRENKKANQKKEIEKIHGYLQDASFILRQLCRVQELLESGKYDESDLLKYHTDEQIKILQQGRPSTISITDKCFRDKIEEALAEVTSEIDSLEFDSTRIEFLSNAIKAAMQLISDYEEIE